MTDEQFKEWAKSFLERTDTYSSWRGAAVEAINMIEAERAKSKQLLEALEGLYNDTKAEHGIHEDDIVIDSSSLGQAKGILRRYESAQ